MYCTFKHKHIAPQNETDEPTKSNSSTFSQSIPALHIVIVAYLPNEVDIFFDRIGHATSRLHYPSTRLEVHVLYNTPLPIPGAEDRLLEM